MKPFYRENAGVFLLLFTMLFLVVAPTHGAGLVAYHYSLITGLLHSYYFLLLVFAIWALYAWKCVSFVAGILQQPAYNFLHLLNYLAKSKRFALFLLVEISLLMPVLLYAALIIGVGWKQHCYWPAGLTIAYLLLLCIAGAVWHLHLLSHTERKTRRPVLKGDLRSLYPFILLRYIGQRQRLKWLGIKIITCGLLYGIARNNTATEYDAATIFWIFNFCILSNSILIFRVREFEERHLSFYRGAPVPLWKRFAEYAWVYFTLLIPELWTLGILTPVHLHITDAINFWLGSFTLLLLLNSITFIYPFRMKTYLKIALGIGCIQFVFLLFLSLNWLYLLFFGAAVLIFKRRYYLYE